MGYKHELTCSDIVRVFNCRPIYVHGNSRNTLLTRLKTLDLILCLYLIEQVHNYTQIETADEWLALINCVDHMPRLVTTGSGNTLYLEGIGSGCPALAADVYIYRFKLKS